MSSASLRNTANDNLAAFDQLRRGGLLDPLTLAAMALSLPRVGTTLALPFEAAARRHPGRTAIVDDFGSITFNQLRRVTDRASRALRHNSIDSRQTVGLLALNHRGFAIASIAAAKAAAPVVYLNTTFSAPQLADVIERENISILIHDIQFDEVAQDTANRVMSTKSAKGTSLRLVAMNPASSWPFINLPQPPLSLDIRLPPKVNPPTILTSGTTGTPRGAQRDNPKIGLIEATAILRAVPFTSTRRIFVGPPLFHAWGSAAMLLAGTLAKTMILRSNFDADDALEDLVSHRADGLVAVPVMLSRLLDAAERRPRRAGQPALKMVVTSGSALPGDLATKWMSRFGPNLYNLYGSTEVGQITVAGPDDLTIHPDTSGRALAGTELAVLDPGHQPLGANEIGLIYGGSATQFSGYSGGGDKDRVGRLVASGDMGYLDDKGRLFVTGRFDDMIVSGGENVFPGEVENVLARHRDIVEVAVVGVDDAEYGQRLAAHVVRRPGSKLTKAAVKKLVRAELATYKVPRDVIWSRGLARTASGKVRNDQLKQH